MDPMVTVLTLNISGIIDHINPVPIYTTLLGREAHNERTMAFEVEL